MSTKNKGLRIIIIPPHLEVWRLSQCGYPDVQRLLEDDAYLKPPLIRGNTVNKPFNAREGNNLVRSGKPLEQGCCGTSLSSSEQYNYSDEEGWGQQTCDQFEGVKPIYYFPTFQKGQFTFAENCLAKKRVYVQTRPQGRMFMCPTFSKQSKESDVSMEKNPALVSMPALALHRSHMFSQKF